jgi:(p)ppGpp synthase/HD superfamily hydrolase
MDARNDRGALLHDAIEDAKATPEEVEKEFGKDVLFLVEGVTKLGKHKYRGASAMRNRSAGFSSPPPQMYACSSSSSPTGTTT